MSFYFPWPSADMSVSTMAEALKERLECYENLYSDDIREIYGKLKTLASSGSDEESISHHLLRLNTFNDAYLQKAFLKYEVKLMELRLDNFTQIDLKEFIKKLRLEAQKMIETKRNFMFKAKQKMCLTCIRVCLLLLRQGALEHAFKVHENEEICQDCDNFCIPVHFQACLDLVASSKYYIKNRQVYVYNFQWKQLILALFKTHLINSLNEIKGKEECERILTEPRIESVFIQVRRPFLRAFPGAKSANSGSFSQSAIDKVFGDFPPCMRRLYDNLQKDNRLGHQDRYDFSVFLKGIGLSLTDQLSYWQEVYMKEPGENAKCSHSWEKDNRRYIYSIRHMYGLEGSKIESFVKPCIDIEEIKEGGCPFAREDDHNLKKLMKNSCNSEDIEVIIHERKKLPLKGCQTYFQAIMSKKYKCHVSDDEINFQNPAEFYLLANKIADKKDQIGDAFDSCSSSEEEAAEDFLLAEKSNNSSSSDEEAN